MFPCSDVWKQTIKRRECQIEDMKITIYIKLLLCFLFGRNRLLVFYTYPPSLYQFVIVALRGYWAFCNLF
jgi:hypothetical protein